MGTAETFAIPDTIPEMADHFKLFGDKSRLAIMALLKEEPLCVCHLVDILGISQPGISQHLRKLKDAGMVSENRKGQWIYYALNAEQPAHVRAVLEQLPPMREIVRTYKEGNGC